MQVEVFEGKEEKRRAGGQVQGNECRPDFREDKHQNQMFFRGCGA